MFEIKKVIRQAAILLAVFCMSDLIAGNSKAYINGSIHTFDENLTVTESILVKDGVIELVGGPLATRWLRLVSLVLFGLFGLLDLVSTGPLVHWYQPDQR